MADDILSGGHVLHELGMVLGRDGDEFRASAPVTAHMWVPGTTALRTSILAAWADTLTGVAAVDDMGPRVPVTLQLEVQVYTPLDGVERVRARTRRIKHGAAVSTFAADFTDDHGEPLATATALYMVAPDPKLLMPPDSRHLEHLAESGGPLPSPFAERAGCERRQPGEARIPLRANGSNASSTLNGGLIALVIEEAALSTQPGASLAMLALNFLRPVRVGPAVARATVRHGVAEVSVVDEGRDEALAATATARSFPTSTPST